MIPNMAQHEVLSLWNMNSNPIFNEFFNTEIFYSQSWCFAHIQTGIQTATTSISRQLILVFILFHDVEVGSMWCYHYEIWTWNGPHKAFSTQSDQMLWQLYVGQALYNRAIHCIVDHMVELAIRGSWFTKDNHLKSCIRYVNALLSVIIFIVIRTKFQKITNAELHFITEYKFL